MFKSYIKIAWRSLSKNKLFTLINITSLAIGLSASFVIGLIVYHDLSFDKFHSEGDLIYRITSDFSTPEGNFYNSGVPVPLGESLKTNVPGIDMVSSFYTTRPARVTNNINKEVYKNPRGVIYTDESYFEVFKYQWIAGNPKAAFLEPNSIVLTQNRAQKYFPQLSPEQVIGNTLTYNDSIVINVTGVIENFDKPTDLFFEEFISKETAIQFGMKNQVFDDNWNNTNSSSQLFVKINVKEKIANIQTVLDKLVKEHEDENLAKYGQERVFHLQPLHDIHFNSNYGFYDYSRDQASKPLLISLICIAVFLLILGCINFINLNTAQGAKRTKEIGIRKTLGGSKKQLAFQFLTETFLLTIAAAVISIFLSFWLIRIFSDFIPKGISFELFWHPVIITCILILLVGVTLLSGFYPALVLSKFKVVSAIKNQILSSESGTPLRKYLTVFQFIIAQVFIIATLLVGKQINFLMAKDMGFKTEAIAFVRAPRQDMNVSKRLQFINDIKTLPQIRNISLGGTPPASLSTNSSTTTYFAEKKEIYTDLQLLYGDQNYLDIYNIKLLAGRKRLNDTIREYVINQTYSNLLGFATPEDAIGKTLFVNNEYIPIVGVMQDFNQRSLRSDIKPMALIGDWYRDQHTQFSTIHFSLHTENTENWSDVIAEVENVWQTIYPNADFELNFIDESIQTFYNQERKVSVLMKWATGLSIIISCLGLLGLVIHTTERRTKEIGIRKVLGASLIQLNLLLCKEFLLLVTIAFGIAAPIAWWGIQAWLQDFAYKTSLSWWIFLLSGGTMLVIALVIMSIKTLSTAVSNPLKSLRTE